MKKSIFKVGFLTTLILILLVSCTSPSEETSAKLPALTNKQKVANSSALPDVYDVYDIPAYIGALHNAGIYAFVDYVQENNLSPYEVGGLTEAMIDTFAMNYVNSMLPPILDQFEISVTCNTDIFDTLCMEYNNIINSTSDVDEINIAILERTDYIYEHFGLQDDDVMAYDIVKEIALATNMLWGNEWDFTQRFFEEPNYVVSNEDGDGNDDEPEKTEEEIRELKMADVSGALLGMVEGIIKGLPGGAAGVAVGILYEGITESIKSSVIVYIAQEIVEVAREMPAEYIERDTYLYDYLLRLQESNYTAYCELFGNKFDGYVY